MKHFNIGLGFIAICASILLAGRALGFSTFGSSGFTRYPTLQLNQDTACQRGCTYTFAQTASISPSLTTLFIDGEQGTQILFEDTRPEHLRIRLITGRITLEGAPAEVIVNKISFNTTSQDSRFEAIHYSWKDQVEVTAKQGAIEYIIPTQNPVEFDIHTITAPGRVLLSTQTGMVVEP